MVLADQAFVAKDERVAARWLARECSFDPRLLHVDRQLVFLVPLLVFIHGDVRGSELVEQHKPGIVIIKGVAQPRPVQSFWPDRARTAEVLAQYKERTRRRWEGLHRGIGIGYREDVRGDEFMAPFIV